MPQLLTSLADFPAELRGGAVSVGNFDGVHRGHAQLIKQLVATASQNAGPALVMTFDPHPATLLYPERPLSRPLTSIPRRAELLFGLGVDALIVYPTDSRLLSLSAHEFFQQKIVDILQARAMVEGPNFHFGRSRDGDVVSLAKMCQAAQMEFRVAQPTQDAAGMISSTRIRNSITAGNLKAANEMLTQPYAISGLVTVGAQRGRTIGFPTANLTEIPELVPGPGVYAGQVKLCDPSSAGQSSLQPYACAVHIGPNPTFAETENKVEVHLIDYAGASLYGQHLRVSVLEQVRSVRKFESIDELRTQIAQDVAACRAVVVGREN